MFDFFAHPHPQDDTIKNPFATLTDQYQLSMAYAHWKQGTHQRQANFQLYFRSNPFEGSYAISAGLGSAIEFLNNYVYDEAQLAHIASLKSANGTTLFDADFIDELRQMRFSCDIDAIPEGEVVFPNEPLLQVRGPILQAQLIESTLLNIINFQTLVATKAARMRVVARDDKLFEFGLRRAQGLGALSVARACYIGGFDGTSNVLAGQIFDIPTVGTHAHSWVMAHDSELESFEAFANAMPHNVVLLVDTYDTANGVDNAIKVGQKLQAKGHQLLGVRLDSGDLAYLSQIAREKLDAAGFTDTLIMASNELDEHLIESLKVAQNAKINAWGVGTQLATCHDDPALNGVYKLTAIENKHGEWEDRIKLSEQRSKMTIPGVVNVYRYYNERGQCYADAICRSEESADSIDMIIDPQDSYRRKPIKYASYRSLLTPIYRAGKLVFSPPSLSEIRQSTQRALSTLDQSHKRLRNPHNYAVGLSRQLDARRDKMMQAAKAYYHQ